MRQPCTAGLREGLRQEIRAAVQALLDGGVKFYRRSGTMTIQASGSTSVQHERRALLHVQAAEFQRAVLLRSTVTTWTIAAEMARTISSPASGSDWKDLLLHHPRIRRASTRVRHDAAQPGRADLREYGVNVVFTATSTFTSASSRRRGRPTHRRSSAKLRSGNIAASDLGPRGSTRAYTFMLVEIPSGMT